MSVGGFNPGIWDVGCVLYVAGVLWGLLKIDATAGERLALALLWPVGPLAFIVTVTLLLIALPVAFPTVGILFWVAAMSLGWLLLTR